MSVLSEGQTIGDVVLFEENNHYSRDEAILTGGDLEIGTVLGQITANEKLTACDPTAADGSQVAVAVLITAAKAASEDVSGLVIARHARMKRFGLKFGAAIDDAPKRAAAVAELKTVGILTDV